MGVSGGGTRKRKVTEDETIASVDDAVSYLTPYELEREKNITRNRIRMKEMGVLDSKRAIDEMREKEKEEKEKKKRAEQLAVPIRRSERLSTIGPVEYALVHDPPYDYPGADDDVEETEVASDSSEDGWNDSIGDDSIGESSDSDDDVELKRAVINSSMGLVFEKSNNIPKYLGPDAKVVALPPGNDGFATLNALLEHKMRKASTNAAPKEKKNTRESQDPNSEDDFGIEAFNDMGSEEMYEEYSQLLEEYESDSSDDDDDVDDEFGGNKEELLDDSDDDDNFAVDKSRKKTSSRLSRENNKKEKISLREYFEMMEVPAAEALRGLGKNATNLSEAIPELCEKNSELIVDLIKKDLANEKRAERIDFSTLEEVEFKWRLHVGETFTRGFGYTSEEEKQALVDRIDSEFARSFDFLIGTIKEDCQKNVQEALETPAPVNLAENFVRGKKNITKVLKKLQVLFEPTFRDEKVGQITKAFRANYGQSSVNNMDDPVPSNDSPAPSQSIVFGVSSSNAGEVFEREKLYGDETFSIDTGIDNVHSLRDLLKQLPAAFDKADQKDIEIVVSMNLGVSTYAVATIGEEENNAQIKELERDLIEYTKKAGTKIPVPPFASYMKERLQISLCYQNPVANIDKCLEGNPMQHTIKKMDEVAQETSKAALTPAERKKLVIIELHVDLTALRAPGRKYHEHMIQKYAKREMKLNMKLVLDFAFEFGFRITVNSRWFFKRLVKYLQSSSTTIGKEYHTMSAEEDLLSPEVASSLSEKWKTSASKDVCEKRATRVLNASLAAASDKIFHISVTSLSGKNAAKTNHPQVDVYCNSHLSQALRQGSNVNMFAIVVLKIMAAYRLSLPDAIQRARSTYYFNNLIARSVVVDFLQELKEKNEEFKNAGKLSYFDVNSFLNPDALKKLICILYSKLPGGEIVDPTNDRAQLRAWRTFVRSASKVSAPELGLWPETIKCSLLRLISIFSGATYECFVLNGKGWQYDFREFGSIAQLSWLINLTMGIRNTRNKKHALEAAKARNEIATKDIDTSADEEAKKERLSVKLKLAKFASAKKYEKRKAEREKASVGSRVLNIVFPPRQVDLANRMINGKEVIKRKDPFWQDIWDNDWIVLPGTKTNGHCLVCKREGVLDAGCVFGKNHFADHYRQKHLKLETQLCDIPKYTQSDYVGVHGHRGKWRARIGSLSLGSFDTEVEAARAYDAVLARDAGKPSNLRAKTNFANEDQNILPELEKQRILTEVEAKRAQIALQKVHARKYIGVSTKNLGSYIAQHHKTHISTYDSAEKAALAHDIFCRSLILCSRMNDTINEGNTKLSVDEKDELHKKIEKVKKKREASLKK